MHKALSTGLIMGTIVISAMLGAAINHNSTAVAAPIIKTVTKTLTVNVPVEKIVNKTVVKRVEVPVVKTNTIVKYVDKYITKTVNVPVVKTVVKTITKTVNAGDKELEDSYNRGFERGASIVQGNIDVAFATPCPSEDSPNCYWDAGNMGNGVGQSFVDIGGVAYYFGG